MKRALSGVAALVLAISSALCVLDAAPSEAAGPPSAHGVALTRVVSFGDAGHFKGAPYTEVVGEVGIAPTPDGKGYWLVSSGGDVVTYGDAVDYGDLYNTGDAIGSPIVGIAATPDGKGYWLVAAGGGVFAFGDAHIYGTAPHGSAIVGIAPTFDGKGYWLADADGHVYAFGDAQAYGYARPGSPIVGIAANPEGNGYWLAASGGGIYASGAGPERVDNAGQGSIVGITADRSTGGFWVVSADGKVRGFGAPSYGSADGSAPFPPMVGIAATADGKGYWVLATPRALSHDVATVAEQRFTIISATATSLGGAGDLYAYTGVCTGSADGYCEAVFFFVNQVEVGTTAGTYSGSSTKPLPGVPAVLPGPGQVAGIRSAAGVGHSTIQVRFVTYTPTEALCCPTGPLVDFDYHWTGRRLVATGGPVPKGFSLDG